MVKSVMEPREAAVRERLAEGLKNSHVPPKLHEGLMEYIVTGRPTGHFLEAVLSNDLREACARADRENQTRLYDIVFFLVNFAPHGCWGTYHHYRNWCNHKGLRGLEAL